MHDLLFSKLLVANHRAEDSSGRYNAKSEQIEDDEKAYCNRHGITGVDIAIRIDDAKKKNRKLDAYFKSYTFWTSEVVRISALLQGAAAFEKMGGSVPDLDSLISI